MSLFHCVFFSTGIQNRAAEQGYRTGIQNRAAEILRKEQISEKNC
jgi:hypothetical protein